MTTFAIILFVVAFAFFLINHFDVGNNPRRVPWITVSLGLAVLTAALFIQATWVGDLHYLNK